MPKHGKAQQKVKWATFLNMVDSQKTTELLEFLWKMDVLEAKSRYALVRYVLQWAYIEMKKQYPNYRDVLKRVEE